MQCQIFHDVLGRGLEHGLSDQSSMFFICALGETRKYWSFKLSEPGLSCGVLAREMLENVSKRDITGFLDYLTNAFATLISKAIKTKTKKLCLTKNLI